MSLLLLLQGEAGGGISAGAVEDSKYLASVAGVVGPPLTTGLFIHGSEFDSIAKAAIAWSVWLEPRRFSIVSAMPNFGSRYGVFCFTSDSAEFVSAGD